MEPFRPFKDSSEVMQYYEVPADVIENREVLHQWALRAGDVSRRAARRKNKKNKKR
jgi:DNA transformation protein